MNNTVNKMLHIPSTRRKFFTGQVVSDKADKTVAVLIDRRVRHPIYGKYVVTSKKILAHDENNAAKIGDIVRVIESRPISKRKCWRLYMIIERRAGE